MVTISGTSVAVAIPHGFGERSRLIILAALSNGWNAWSGLIKVGKSSEAVLRIFGTILIIVIAVFLVVAGYSDTQIAPVMGLLGTIAGYLLGKESREKPPTAAPTDTAKGTGTS